MTEKLLLIELTNKNEFLYKVKISAEIINQFKEEYRNRQYFEDGDMLLVRIVRTSICEE